MATNVKDIMNYFGYKTAGEFMRDWKQLSDSEKEQLRSGIENGTLTY